jgi:O-antigen/teichoic acid export membrane protein
MGTSLSTSRKVVYNVAVAAGSKILGTLLGFVILKKLTVHLGQADFGYYSVALAYFAFFNSLGDWGIYQTVTRKISRPGADEAKILGNAFGLRIAISASLVLLASLVSWLFLWAPFLEDSIYPDKLFLAIILAAVAAFFSSSYAFLNSLFQKKLLTDRVAVVELLGKVVQAGLIILGVVKGWGLVFFVGVMVVFMFFNWVGVYLQAQRLVSFRPNFDWDYWKKFLRQSYPIGLSILVTFAYFKADTILLSFLKPDSPGDVGIYQAAYKIIDNLSFFPGMIVGLATPMFAFNFVENKIKFKRLVNQTFRIFSALVIPLIVGTQLLAEDIILLVTSPEFIDSAQVLKIIIFAIGFIFFGQLFNSVLIVSNLQKDLFRNLLICALFSVSLNLIFIPQYSYLATSTVSVLTEALVVILGLVVIYRKVKFLPSLRKIVPILFSAFLMGGFIFLVRDMLPVLAVIGLSPLVYFSALIATRAVEKEEVLELVRKNE